MFGVEIDVWDLATLGALAVLLLAIASALLSISSGSSAAVEAERKHP